MKTATLFSPWLLLVIFVAPLAAQVPSPLPNPNVNLYNHGVVKAIVRLPDGSMVVGGVFDAINGTPRNNIAKFQADGTLDLVWDPSSNGEVDALATNTNGDVYAGGPFNSIGGQNRIAIAKLAGTGSGAADAAWNSPATGPDNTWALATDSAGNVFASGNFTIGGQSRGLVKLSGTGSGTIDAAWDPSIPNGVFALAAHAGYVYAGGYFTSIGGQNRNYIAKLSGTGSGAADATWNPSANGTVYALTVDASGNVYAGGFFYSIGGQNRNHLAKLSGTGTGAANAIWDPNPSINSGSSPPGVSALATDTSGNIYVGGYFTSIGGQNRINIAKLAGTGTGAAVTTWKADTAFSLSSNGNVSALATDAIGKLYVGGQFRFVSGQSRLGLVSLSQSGVVGNAINTSTPAHVFKMASQPGGAVIVGGDFGYANGLPRFGAILRLKPDGTLDTVWNPYPCSSSLQFSCTGLSFAIDAAGDVYVGGTFSDGASTGGVVKVSGTGSGAADTAWHIADYQGGGGLPYVAIDSDDNLFVSGSFTSVDGQSRNTLAKLHPDGTVDSVWNPSPTGGSVGVMAFDAGGNLYVGGYFSGIGGQSRNNIAKLSRTGSGAADAAWNPSANDFVFSLATDATGNLYAGGAFTQIGGQNHSRIAKLSGTGSGAADAAWNPSSTYFVEALAVDANGDLYAGGEGAFSSGGPSSPYVAKVSGADGVVDATWNPSPNDLVDALVFDKAGNPVVGGYFSAIGGQPRAAVAALPPEVPLFADGFE